MIMFSTCSVSSINDTDFSVLLIPTVNGSVMDSNTEFTHDLGTITITKSKMVVKPKALIIIR